VTANPTASPPPRTAADLCAGIRLSPPARKLLEPNLLPGDFLKRLIDNNHFVDTIRLMAIALRRREAVWWACLCTRHACRDKLPPAEREALRAAVQWVLDPTEEKRKAAATAANAAGARTPAGCAAKAAALAAQPSLVRSAKVVAAGVFLAAACCPPAERDVYRQFVAVGLDVDDGTATWAQPDGRQ